MPPFIVLYLFLLLSFLLVFGILYFVINKIADYKPDMPTDKKIYICLGMGILTGLVCTLIVAGIYKVAH
jgi:L-cystine uptake protein TcyP (sodium:dicarboxylate symporter family)